MDKVRPGLKTLFLSHQSADPDAIGCLYFLQKRYEGDVALPNPPDRRGKPLAEYLGLDYGLPPLKTNYEQYVVVDTPNPQQLDPIELPLNKTVIIDHHPSNGWDIDVFTEERTSCAEMIYELVDPETLSKDEGIALVAGILTDTSGFSRGTCETFRILSDIMDASGITIPEVYSIISSERSYSEKICRLKGAERSSHLRENGFLIAYTYVKSFESSVCGMLLRAGADIAFTGSQRGDEFLISSRCLNEMVEHGVSLGEIFHDLAEDVQELSGGGHTGAAVLKGKGDVKEYMTLLVQRTQGLIREKDISRSTQ
ncbi:MAG: DHH family phosphoesterase [Thermoplasmata archaeon]